jgi:sterol 14-demethylase
MHLHKAFSELIINTASRCLMGEEIRETMHTRVAELYEALNDGMTRVSILFPYFPLEKHTARDKARAEMVKLFSPIIDRRRENAKNGITNPTDFLQELVDCRYENRREMTNDEIVGLLIACLFAGQHTSNITATWLGCAIAAHKDKLLPRLLAEQRSIVGADFKDGDQLPYEAVQQMELLHFSIKEVLRMFPPIVVMMRTVQEDQQFMGYTIPKGDIIASSPSVSHRIPEIFKNPDEFDPDRFLPPRSEGEDIIDDDGNISKQWKFIAFGEGRHQCIGRDFAFLQVKAIFSYIFRHFDMELVHPFVGKQNFDHLVAGPGTDSTVRYKRKNLVKESA